jgi:hypothetical protein
MSEKLGLVAWTNHHELRPRIVLSETTSEKRKLSAGESWSKKKARVVPDIEEVIEEATMQGIAKKDSAWMLSPSRAICIRCCNWINVADKNQKNNLRRHIKNCQELGRQRRTETEISRAVSKWRAEYAPALDTLQKANEVRICLVRRYDSTL